MGSPLENAIIQAAQGQLSFRAARDLYDDILAAHPNNIHSLHNMAVAMTDVGRPDEAERFARLAVEQLPDSTLPLSVLIYAVYCQRRFQEAAELVLKARAMVNPSLLWQPLTDSQYKTSQETIAEIYNLFTIREARASSETALPDGVWKGWHELFSPAGSPTREMIETMRFHLTFTGRPLVCDLARIQGPLPGEIARIYGELTKGLPSQYILKPPAILGEIGWRIDDTLVNNNTLKDQDHITYFHLNGCLEHLSGLGAPPRILEIGAGYGGVVYGLHEILKPASIHIIDLPETLGYSSLYLRLGRNLDRTQAPIYSGKPAKSLIPPPGGICFVPNFLAQDLAGKTKFDFIINSGSFGEMSRPQVAEYVELINDVLSEDGIVYDVNAPHIVDVFEKHFKGTIVHVGIARFWAKNRQVLEKLMSIAPACFKTTWGRSAELQSKQAWRFNLLTPPV